MCVYGHVCATECIAVRRTCGSQFLCALWILRIELCLYLLRYFMNPFHLDKVLPYTPAAGIYGLPALASQVLRLGVCQYILQE